MALGKPGARRSGGGDGYRIADLDGTAVVLTVTGTGEVVTSYSDGKPRAYVDVRVIPLDGPDIGDVRETRLFGAYLLQALDGYGVGESVIGRVEHGKPDGNPGLRAGWVLREVDDPKLIKAGEAAVG